METKKKIRKTFNIDSDIADKFKIIVPDNEQSKRINQFMIDEIELHSDLILESEPIMLLKRRLGNLNTSIKEKNKLYKDLTIQIPFLENERDFIISEIEKQRKNEGNK